MDNEIGDGNKLIYGGGPKFGKLKTLYTNIESIWILTPVSWT